VFLLYPIRPLHPLGKGSPPFTLAKVIAKKDIKTLTLTELGTTNIRKGGFLEPQIFREAETQMFGKAEPQI
jgi:hypothetical protein